MKVYVTQGHEAGIGLEVFFKSCLLLSEDELSQLVLIAFPDSVHKTLNLLNIPHQIEKNQLRLNLNYFLVDSIHGNIFRKELCLLSFPNRFCNTFLISRKHHI